MLHQQQDDHPQELEERVLNCLPVAFYSVDIFDERGEDDAKRTRGTQKRTIRQDIEGSSTQKGTQTSLMQQIQDGHAEGRPRLAILDDQLDELDGNATNSPGSWQAHPPGRSPSGQKIEKLTQFNPANIAR